MKKNLVTKILLATMFLFIFSTVVEPLASYANPQSYEEEFFDADDIANTMLIEDMDYLTKDTLEDIGVNTDDDFSEFNEELLDEDFDVEAAVERLDLATLEGEERETFLKVIEETAATSGAEEVDLLEESLINLFDSNSEYFGDIEAAQDDLIDNYVAKIDSEENSFLVMSKNLALGTETAYAKKKRAKYAVGMYFFGSVLNVVIGGIVGGGSTALQSYIKKKGKKAVSQTLSRAATAAAKRNKINAVKGVAIAGIITHAVYVALDYLNVGLQISKQIEKRDMYPGNEWIDIKN
ncbi:hypothetical protein [Shouchella miscanthi]|uniref:Uncharacterized protein n=1 Tax=Shouchella miscanthi TaxID=2598861 RepID=A0ABU6NLM4_9BACI|nr:hypothetical protein [Shouchella miscanthi]